MAGMKYWLVKTEPDVYSIDDLKRDRRTEWTGVRNYQARNFLQEMSRGDLALIYHSNAEPSGVAGIGKVVRLAQADPTQFDRKSEFYEPKATLEAPRWFCPEIAFVEKFASVIALSDLRENRALQGLLLLQKGSRLSVIPVTEKHFREVVEMAG
jgi:predicted RNA-binding protein with PUA-like domain